MGSIKTRQDWGRRMARDEKHILIHNILIGNALEQSTNGIDEKRSGRDEKIKSD